MTRYEVLRLAHVLGAIAWVGGGLGLLVLSRRLVAVRDYPALVSLGNQSQALGNRLFMPAALVAVVSGVALVLTEPAFGFTDLWILIGIGGIVASGIAQTVLAQPAGKRFQTLMTEHGPDHPGVADAARRMTLGNAADVGILLIVVWAMVAKPML